MSKIKVSSVTKGQLPVPGPETTPIPMYQITDSSVPNDQPPCPGPAPTPIPMPRPEPTDAPMPCPPPPPFFRPGPCCPSTTQVVDNITVQSLDPDKIEVVEGKYLGMKAFGIDAKTFEGIGTTGMVPMPKEGDKEKYLRADGKWSILPWYQSDWEEEDPRSPSYIRNKPVIDTELDANSPNAIANSAVTRAIDDIIERLDNIQPVDDADIVEIVQDTMQPGDGEPSINFDNMNIGG